MVAVPYRLLRNILIAAAVLYCSLLLELAAGFPLDVHRSFLSDLAAQDQPTSPYARGMDLGTGVLLLIVAVLGRHAARMHWDLAGLLICTTIFAVGTMSDALAPIDCAASLSAACAAAENSGQAGATLLLHEVTSGVAGFGSFAMAFFVVHVLSRSGWGGLWGRLVAVLSVGVAASEIWLGIVTGINALHGDVAHGPGILQRVSVLLICLMLGTLMPGLRHALSQ